MYILALAFLMQMDSIKPIIMEKPPTGQEECFDAARKLMDEDYRIKTDEMRQAGASYICLKVTYPV